MNKLINKEVNWKYFIEIGRFYGRLFLEQFWWENVSLSLLSVVFKAFLWKWVEWKVKEIIENFTSFNIFINEFFVKNLNLLGSY